MIEIKGTVTGLKISLTEKPPVTTGNRKSVRTVFEFEGELWDVCEKRVVFWNAKNPKDKIPMPLDVNNSCDVPAYVLTNVGHFYFGIIGLAEDGEVKKVSTIIKYPLAEGTPDGTTDVEEMPPDIWEQQLAIMGETLGAAQEAVSIANYAVSTANEAVEKLDLTYVDEEGVMHIYACENLKAIAPTLKVSKSDEYVTITATNVDGSIQSVMIPIPEDGEDGGSATIQVMEIEGGYTLTIRDASGTQSIDIMHGKDGSGTVETLSGDTASVTPLEVATAVQEGKPVLISHTDATYGTLHFMDFSVAENYNLVAASVVFEMVSSLFTASLAGNIEDGTWYFTLKEMATADDIPEEKTVTAVDLSGYESGTIVETYSDGSTLTHNLTFDSDGNITKIVDSDGNETVITW